jgi:hypothetical protein
VAPAFAWAKEDGSLDPAWIDRLPDDIKGSDSLKPISTIIDLAKNYVHTKSMVGKKLEAPGENATPEQIAAWRKTVGAPENPDGYYPEGTKSLRPEVVPEGLWDANNEKAFIELAHKHHLPPAAVKEILGFYGNSIAKGLESSQAKQAEVFDAEMGKLKTAFGAEFDSSLADARRVAITLGLKVDKVENGQVVEAGDPLFSSASAVIAFAKMAKLLSEDKLVKGDTGTVNGTIKDRIRDIQDPKSQSQLARDYRGENGPERALAAQQQLHQLMSAAA